MLLTEEIADAITNVISMTSILPFILSILYMIIIQHHFITSTLYIEYWVYVVLRLCSILNCNQE